MRKEALFSVFGIVLAIAIGLSIGELVIRAKNSSMKNYDIEMWQYARTLKVRSPDPLLGHEHKANSEAILQSVTIRTDDHGLRGTAPSPDAARRILFLGSSITLGWGVEEDKTMPVVVGRLLREGGQDVTVLNAGIGNYNAPRYVRRYLTRLADLNPTDIVVQAFVRDGEALDAGDGSWLLRNSQLAMTLWIAAHRVFDKSGQTALTDHYTAVYDPKSASRAEMEKSLAQLAEAAKAKNIRLWMVMTPDVHDLKTYRLGFVHDIFRDVAARNGYAWLDLKPALGDLPAEQLWAMPGDPHPNALGHELMAKAVASLLSGK